MRDSSEARVAGHSPVRPQMNSLLLFGCLLETKSLYVALAILELTVKARLALNSKRSADLCLLSAGIKGT